MTKLILISFLIFSATALAELRAPFASNAMFCGKPDPRISLADGTYKCVNESKREIVNAEFTLKAGALEGSFKAYTPEGLPAVEANYRKGKLQGDYRTEYNEKKKRFDRIGQYENGVLNGTLRQSNNFNDNVLISYYQLGKKHGHTLVINGQKIVDLRECEVNGLPADSEKCDDIIVPGFELPLANLKKAKLEEKQKQQDELNKLVEVKNKQGYVIERFRRKNGQFDGKRELFYENGKPMSVLEYINGRKVASTEYFLLGEVKSKSVYDGTKPSTPELERSTFHQNEKPKSWWKITDKQGYVYKVAFKEYYENGQLSEEGTRTGSSGAFYEPGAAPLDGPYKRYNPAGELIEEGAYKDAQRIGPWMQILPGQTPQLIHSDYENGRLLKKTVSNAVTKKKLRETTYKPDGSVNKDQTF